MPRQAYLNELSFANGRVSADDGRTLFEQLFQLLRAIDRRCKGVTVVGHCSLAELTIGRCSVGVWLRDDRDRRRLLRAIDNRAPFDADMARLADEMAAALEYRYGDREAIGLGLASWHDGLAVSVDVAPWRIEAVRLLRHQVFEDDDGELAEETVNVRARNAADAAHLQAHDDWLQAPTRNLPRTPDELWLNRDLVGNDAVNTAHRSPSPPATRTTVRRYFPQTRGHGFPVPASGLNPRRPGVPRQAPVQDRSKRRTGALESPPRRPIGALDGKAGIQVVDDDVQRVHRLSGAPVPFIRAIRARGPTVPPGRRERGRPRTRACRRRGSSRRPAVRWARRHSAPRPRTPRPRTPRP